MKRYFSMISITLLIAAAAVADDGMNAADHDRIFADAMTRHHQDGISMARMALDKAESPELRSMARKMIDDQTRESGELQSLRGQGPKATMAEMMKITGMMPESQTRRDMARLEAGRGREFDLAFTEIMPMHHDGAIKMSRDQVRNGKNAGLNEIARNIITKQSAEKKQLMALHRQLDKGQQPMVSSSSERRRMAKE